MHCVCIDGGNDGTGTLSAASIHAGKDTEIETQQQHKKAETSHREQQTPIPKQLEFLFVLV